jgi:hypothetical protein
MDLTHCKAVPVTVMTFEQPASNRGPMHERHDFFTFIVMSNNFSSVSHAVNVLCKSESDGNNSKMSSAYRITKL